MKIKYRTGKLDLLLKSSLIFAAAVICWVYWPATHASFVIDDYVFLAMSRLVENPLAAFWQNHFYEPYYFRPTGLVSWWLAQRVFGLYYAAHSAINLGLHLVNVALLFALLRSLRIERAVAGGATAFFALAPFSLAAAFWPSNRFDLWATLFLLLLARQIVIALNAERLVTNVVLLIFFAIAGCFSKEHAFSASMAMALCVLAKRDIDVRRRAIIFFAIGAAVASAFFWRHHLLSAGYAVMIGNPMLVIAEGLWTLAKMLPQLASQALGGVRGAIWFVAVGALFLYALAMSLPARAQARTEPISVGTALAAAVVMMASLVAQAPVGHLSAPIADGSPLGTITYTRFYYAPAAALAVLFACALARLQKRGVVTGILCLLAIVGAVWLRPLSKSFAQWTHREIAPYSVAATAVADATEAITEQSPCVLVFLGTQKQHPLFRMFADVTVKARTAVHSRVAKCFVMTETTPWVFAFPRDYATPEVGLQIISTPTGTPKQDTGWDTIRYRHRMPPPDLATLRSARFFDWQNGAFVEVTEQVRGGERKVPSRGWEM
ncbi:MAG: hypothetical protein ACRCWJ_13640 [Casimicrobium sp.]